MYIKAIDKILKHEGIYSNDPHDMGAETYRGISRRYHPNWSGWEIIDSKKSLENFEAIIKHDNNLLQMVKEYYKSQFYDKYILPLGVEDSSVSGYIFDMSVNIGSWAKILQRAINKRLKELQRDKLKVDGKIGPKSLKALKEVEKNSILIAIVEYRVKHYIKLVINRPTQIRFLMGWVNRSFDI
jgi:lysozyme family protein